MVSVRPATADDYDAFARLFPELRVDDPTPSREKWAAELVPTALVAEVDGAVVGYTWYQLYAAEGIVRHVVVAPPHQGRRLGEALLRAVAALMRARGLSRWALNVKPDNGPALALYRRLGMQPAYESQSLRFDWALVERLPVPAPSFVARPLTPGLDADAEAHQGLPRGSLATARALPQRVLACVQDGPRVVAAAVFSPTFPGAYPFRADGPAAARALLEALRPHALPEPPYMQAVIEGQPALARALGDAGAAVRLDILHLEGPVPDGR